MSVCPVGDNLAVNEFINRPVTVTPGEKKVYPPMNNGQPVLRDESCNVVNSTTQSTGGTDVPNGTSSTTTLETVTYVEPKQGWGFKWEGPWAAGNAYVKQSDEHPLASTVEWNGSTYVCIEDHISEAKLAPVSPDSTFNYKGAWSAGEVYVTYSNEHSKSDVVEYQGKKYMCIQDHISEEINAPMDPDVTGVGTGSAYWSVVSDEEGSVGEGLTYWELAAKAGANGSGTGYTAPKSYLDQLMDFKDNVFDWIKNADLTDWLEAAAIAAGVIWAGSKVLDMMEPDAAEDPNADKRYNGSAGYSGAYSAPSLKTVIASLCDYAGILYDISALPDEDCEFTIGQTTSVRTIVEQLSLAYQFDMINSGGVLKFVPRHVDAIKTITLEDMGFSTSTTPPAPYTAKRFQGVDLPRFVSLTYYAEDVDYNKFTQSSELFTYEDGQNVNLEVPVTLSHERAKQICEISLINSHLERMNYKFSTSYKFIDVEPGDILNSPMGLIRILKVTETEEGVLEFEASDAGSDAAITASNLNVQTPPAVNRGTSSSSIGKSGAFWIDPTNLDDKDVGVRIYAAVHGYGRAGWPGAAIYMSEDNGQTYEQIGTASQEATVGLVSTATPSADYHFWDNTTEITVTLKTGSLLSMSETAVLNGANRAQVGQELIGFCNATLIGEKTYKLSKLLRGRQGTEQFIGTHQPNELFCLIDNSLVRIDLDDADRGTTKKFKVVTNGSTLDVVEAEDVQIISNNTRMWTVYTPVIGLSGQDWIISWNERVRYDNQLKDFATTNHDPDWAGFGVAILDADGNVKSSGVVQGNKYTYSAAQQVADFGDLQSSIKVSIVQMSQKWGGGFPVVINN